VVCLAPRAPGDSVRPRRLFGAVVRPLNFTVRRSGTPRWVRLVSLPWDSSLGWLSFRSYCGGLPYFIQPWGSTAATS